MWVFPKGDDNYYEVKLSTNGKSFCADGLLTRDEIIDMRDRLGIPQERVHYPKGGVRL